MKKIMIIAAMMLATLSVNAQEFFIKPMAGGTLTTITGDVDDVKMKIGFTGGVELGYHFNEMFALTAGALYSMQGAKFDSDQTKSNYTFDYLNVPLLFNVYVAPGLALKAGGQLGFLLKAKLGDHDYKDYYKSTDISIPVGLSYEFDNVVIDARYNIGVSNISKDEYMGVEYMGVKNDYKAHNSVIMLTIGYKIPF